MFYLIRCCHTCLIASWCSLGESDRDLSLSKGVHLHCSHKGILNPILNEAFGGRLAINLLAIFHAVGSLFVGDMRGEGLIEPSVHQLEKGLLRIPTLCFSRTLSFTT